MEIERCNCGHPALSYHGIDRHFSSLFDGRQIYSDTCQNPDCRCERAKIQKSEPSITIQKEKQSWARVIQEAMA